MREKKKRETRSKFDVVHLGERKKSGLKPESEARARDNLISATWTKFMFCNGRRIEFPGELNSSE